MHTGQATLLTCHMARRYCEPSTDFLYNTIDQIGYRPLVTRAHWVW